MKKVYAYLNGGIGNQMFQYATARALALDADAELVVDDWSGFIRDYEYSREFELDKLPIKAKIASPLERLPLWLLRIENRLFGTGKHLFHSKFYGNFLVETEMRFLNKIFDFKNSKKTWLCGYWQSPLYFENYSQLLGVELMPPEPTQMKFLELGLVLQQVESVALGIRLYEESENPAAHLKNGQSKTIEEINKAIKKMIELEPKSKFFVFCTHRSPILNRLNLPDSTTYLTHDDGYEGTIERLWLMTRCKHHIFTPSSYYWWGAWLSQQYYSASSTTQNIFGADNFINQDGLCNNWELF